MSISALYPGHVVHQRLRPVRHRLKYAVFYLFLDLDELPALARRLWLFSHDRWNILAFHESDHGDGQPGGLRGWVEGQLRAAGLPDRGGAIRVLCMPRILGHAFNPITVFFCHGADGGLLAMIYEVRNTFGEKHCYLIPVRVQETTIRQVCDKRFYVSPFMPMALTYRFRVQAPARQCAIGITAADDAGVLIATAFSGARQALSDAALLGRFLRMPLLGMKVVAAIHWEALKIWCKGVRLRPRPLAPALPVSILS